MNGKTVRESLERIQAAVRAFDKDALTEAGKAFEKLKVDASDLARFSYWRGYLEYRLATFCFEQAARESEAAKHIDKALSRLENAVRSDPADEESFALLGTLTAMKIKLNLLSALWLGPRSDGYFDKAEKLNPENPRLHYLKGIITFYKPEFAGGGARKAAAFFKHATSLFESEATEEPGDALRPRWGYGECLYFLGRACLGEGKKEEARGWFTKANEIDPESKLLQKALAESASDQT